jgi:hypothetical protein
VRILAGSPSTNPAPALASEPVKLLRPSDKPEPAV